MRAYQDKIKMRANAEYVAIKATQIRMKAQSGFQGLLIRVIDSYFIF